MTISELTPREARVINPTQDNLFDTVEYLFENGWQFRPDNTRLDKAPYSWGWWINPAHPVKCRPCGDPGDFHFKAWDTLKNYALEAN